MYNFFKKNKNKEDKEGKEGNELNNLSLYIFIGILVIYELVILFFLQKHL